MFISTWKLRYDQATRSYVQGTSELASLERMLIRLGFRASDLRNELAHQRDLRATYQATTHGETAFRLSEQKELL